MDSLARRSFRSRSSLTLNTLFILLFTLLSSSHGEDIPFILELPYQEVHTQISKASGSPIPISAVVQKNIEIDVLGRKQPVLVQSKNEGALPETFFSDTGSGVVWSLVSDYFSSLEEFPDRKTVQALGISGEDPLSLEWVSPPEYDYHHSAYRFYLLIKRGSYLHAYSKTILLTQEGSLSFEINGSHSDASLRLFELLRDKLSLPDEVAYSRHLPTKYFKAERRFRSLVLPIGAKISANNPTSTGGFLEENRKATGVFFLLFSILFFLFIAPRMK
jgi:hypothetical protein